MTSVLDHLEAFVGDIVGGWRHDADGNPLPFQVVQTKGGPYEGTVTFSTLGLSKMPLADRSEGQEHGPIRQELVILVPKEAVPRNVVGILQQAGMEAIERGLAYLRGDVVGPKGALFEGCEPKALYVSMPVYFPDAFAAVTTEESGRVVFAWLIPILDGEFHLWHTHGWPALERKMMDDHPDLVDYRRKSA